MRAVALEFDERFRVEVLRVHDRGIHIGEDAKLVRYAHIVAIGRHTVTDNALAHLAIFKGLDHVVLSRHLANPLVRLHRHHFLQVIAQTILRLLTARDCGATSRVCHDAPTQ